MTTIYGGGQQTKLHADGGGEKGGERKKARARKGEVPGGILEEGDRWTREIIVEGKIGNLS